jgi:hypothetical protein
MLAHRLQKLVLLVLFLLMPYLYKTLPSMLDLGSHYAHWSFGFGGGAGCFVEYGYTKAEEFT